MNLREITQTLDFRITGGSEYQWACYGADVRYLDFESDYASVSVIFDSVDQTVYSVDICTKEIGSIKPYRWLNSDYKDAYYKEAKKRNIDADIAWDDVKWYDLDVEEDFLEKAHAIFNGEEFDNRIQVPLDLDNDTVLALALEAHKRDITINKMVEIILLAVIANRAIIDE